MFNPSIKQIKIEVDRLNEIDYETVFKYHNIIENRIIRLGKLLRKNCLQLTTVWFKYLNIVRKFNDYCKSEYSVPQNY